MAYVSVMKMSLPWCVRGEESRDDGEEVEMMVKRSR
jgi:hypothetical protein